MNLLISDFDIPKFQIVGTWGSLGKLKHETVWVCLRYQKKDDMEVLPLFYWPGGCFGLSWSLRVRASFRMIVVNHGKPNETIPNPGFIALGGVYPVPSCKLT